MIFCTLEERKISFCLNWFIGFSYIDGIQLFGEKRAPLPILSLSSSLAAAAGATAAAITELVMLVGVVVVIYRPEGP